MLENVSVSIFCTLGIPYDCDDIKGGQPNFTPEIEVFFMLYERSLSILSTTSVKCKTAYIIQQFPV